MAAPYAERTIVPIPRFLLVLVLAGVAYPGATAAEPKSKTNWKLSVEGGSEYDTNLHRVEVLEGEIGGVDEGAVMRSAAHYQIAHSPAPGKLFSLETIGTTKLFTVPEGQSENLAILYANGRYQQRWGKTRALVGARANYYEAFDIRPFGEGEDPVVGRSFSTTDAELSLTVPSEDEDRVAMIAGYRDFVYKPDADFNWRGEHLGLRYTTMFWLGDPDKDEEAASIDFRAEYRIDNRSYEGAAFRNACSESEMVVPDCFVPTFENRSDLNHLLVIEGSYTGSHIFSLLYAAEVVDSNSYGQASVRHRVEGAITTEAPGEIFLTAKAVVRFNRFLDPLLLARDVQSQTFVSIEDENRNSLSLDLARDMGENWGLEARLALYSNEFATEVVSFRRQTAYLGALYRFGSESDSQSR
jgi:hypothetical protein